MSCCSLLFLNLKKTGDRSEGGSKVQGRTWQATPGRPWTASRTLSWKGRGCRACEEGWGGFTRMTDDWPGILPHHKFVPRAARPPRSREGAGTRPALRPFPCCCLHGRPSSAASPGPRCASARRRGRGPWTQLGVTSPPHVRVPPTPGPDRVQPVSPGSREGLRRLEPARTASLPPPPPHLLRGSPQLPRSRFRSLVLIM